MSKDLIYSLKNVGLYYKKMAILPWKQNAKFWALRDVSFDVHSGETLGIIGRNGAGKSTLLQILANILKPDRGEVYRANNIVATLLTLGVGFEPRLTGRLNIAISGMLLGMSRRDMLRLSAATSSSRSTPIPTA
jgi:lipopolysaccharide transport system ATP-binding protein